NYAASSAIAFLSRTITAAPSAVSAVRILQFAKLCGCASPQMPQPDSCQFAFLTAATAEMRSESQPRRGHLGGREGPPPPNPGGERFSIRDFEASFSRRTT